MKQKISAPAAVGIAVVVIGALGFVLYRQFLAPPPTDTSKSYGSPMAGMKYEDMKGKINPDEMKKRMMNNGGANK